MLEVQSIDRFRLFGRIGRGGMGAVYGGFDTLQHRFVAIKTLFREFNEDRDVVARFRREARLYDSLNHPNVVECIASGYEAGSHFIILEWVEGDTVAQLLSSGPLAVPEALRITTSVALALDHAHGLGIIHRDVKPSNVCINQDGWVKLLDFGIAHADDEDELTETGVVIGTTVYASPEQNQGRALDRRSDLYSLGIMLFEMLTGRRPWKGRSVIEVLKQQALRRVAPPSRFRSDLPPRLDDMVRHLVERLPERRYDGASALLLDLESLRAELGTGERTRLFGDGYDEMWESVRRAHAEKRFAEALEMGKIVESHRPSTASVESLLGKLYAQQGLSYAASDRFERALRLKPGDVRTRLDFVCALYHLDMLKRAQEEAERILEVEESNVFARGMVEWIASRRCSERVQTSLPPNGAVVEAPVPPLRPTLDRPSMDGPPPEGTPTDPSIVSEMGQVSRPLSRTLSYGEPPVERTPLPASDTTRSNRPVLRLDPSTAVRARWLSLLFCGLGHFCLGSKWRGIRSAFRGALLLVVVVGTFLAASHDLSFPLAEAASFLDPDLGQFVVSSGLIEQIHDYGRLFLWGLSFLALILLLRLWKHEADEAYRAGMVRVLSGAVCRSEGDHAQIDVGGLQGVRPGQVFLVSKHVHQSQIRSLGEAVAEEGDRYFPVARFTAETVHPLFSEGHWEHLPGVTGTPLEGDPVTPVV